MQLFACFNPSVTLRRQLPVRGAFWMRLTISYIKPALQGEVAMSDSELTEGLRRGFSVFRQPLSRLAATAPRLGSLLGATTAQKLSPFTGKVDTSKASGRKGCGWGAVLCFFTVPPQSRLAPCQLPRKRWRLLVVQHRQKLSPRAGKVAANEMSSRKGCGSEVDFAKQKTEGVSLPERGGGNER